MSRGIIYCAILIRAANFAILAEKATLFSNINVAIRTFFHIEIINCIFCQLTYADVAIYDYVWRRAQIEPVLDVTLI